MIKLHHGDCLDVLRTMSDASVDAIVTDPPYGLRFMGKRWDYDVPTVEIWAECLRVLKPGGHLLAFAGTRTQHRMAVRIEDSGFEIRDMIAWVYGSGFPKSLDVSKNIDKKAGAARGTIKVAPRPATSGTMAAGCDTRPWIEKSREVGYHEVADKNAVTDEARRWQGWGTSLKPALEPLTVARKPLDGTVAENVLAHGTGAINVDGCRIQGGITGRWPANLIHDGSEEVVGLFPLQKSGNRASGVRKGMVYHGADGDGGPAIQGSSGSAARFFYTAKADATDRNDGLLPDQRNKHPTVKPVDLMRYLCRLVTPPGGIVLDPFMGSGSTGKACVMEGFSFIGIERDADSFATAQARVVAPMPLFKEML